MKYIKPEVVLEEFEPVDVITASGDDLQKKDDTFNTDIMPIGSNI